MYNKIQGDPVWTFTFWIIQKLFLHAKCLKALCSNPREEKFFTHFKLI